MVSVISEVSEFSTWPQTAASDDSESDESENDDESYNEGIEAVVCRCSSKQGFLKISQISQENNYVEASL